MILRHLVCDIVERGDLLQVELAFCLAIAKKVLSSFDMLGGVVMNQIL